MLLLLQPSRISLVVVLLVSLVSANIFGNIFAANVQAPHALGPRILPRQAGSSSESAIGILTNILAGSSSSAGASPTSTPEPSSTPANTPISTPGPSSTPESTPSSTPGPSSTTAPASTASSKPAQITSTIQQTTLAEIPQTTSTFTPEVTTVVIIQTSSDGSLHTISSVSSSVPTTTASPVDSSAKTSDGMSTQTRNTVIGVVCGVGGAIFIALIFLVFWKFWGRRRAAKTAMGEDDGLMMTSQEKSDGGHSGNASNNPFQSTLESYHAPMGRVNASSNF